MDEIAGWNLVAAIRLVLKALDLLIRESHVEEAARHTIAVEISKQFFDRHKTHRVNTIFLNEIEVTPLFLEKSWLEKAVDSSFQDQ
jgi:hypothetical protein